MKCAVEMYLFMRGLGMSRYIALPFGHRSILVRTFYWYSLFLEASFSVYFIYRFALKVAVYVHAFSFSTNSSLMGMNLYRSISYLLTFGHSSGRFTIHSVSRYSSVRLFFV